MEGEGFKMGRCLFCGKDKLRIYWLPDSKSRHVFCDGCGAAGPWGDTTEEALTLYGVGRGQRGVFILVAIDEDVRVRECIALTDDHQAQEVYAALQGIWGGSNVAMASRLIDDVPSTLHDRDTQTVTEIVQ